MSDHSHLFGATHPPSPSSIRPPPSKPSACVADTRHIRRSVPAGTILTLALQVGQDPCGSVVQAYDSFSTGQRSRGRITCSPFPICTESLSKSRRTPSGMGVSFADSHSASILRAAPNSAASINSSAERAWSNGNRPPNRMMSPRSRPVRSACVAKSKTRQSCAPQWGGHALPRASARLELDDGESGSGND
jgi:hypothetical protein